VSLLAGAAIAIVLQDHTLLRPAPRASAAQLTELPQGEVVEIRGESPGYLKVYDYQRERGGYIRSDAAHTLTLTAAEAPGLLAVVRFLRDTPGVESLGISYGAAYLRAVPAGSLMAEPFDAIGRMAERLADRASGSSTRVAQANAQLEVVAQFGIRTVTFEQDGHVRVCYDGDMFRRVLAMPGASAEARAQAALALTRADCADPGLGPLQRAAADRDHAQLLGTVADSQLSPLTRSRLNLRRASVWSAIAFAQARSGEPAAAATRQARAALAAAHEADLGEDRQGEYREALLQVAAVRWGAVAPTPLGGPLALGTAPGQPGETCIALSPRGKSEVQLIRRCTYGIVWTASAQVIDQGRALVLAVQPLPGWRELWVFRESGGTWRIDILPPGLDGPGSGYAEFAGFAPDTRRLLVVREVTERGGVRRRFEEFRIDDLHQVRQASTPDLLMDFGSWTDPQWRNETLALR
jgi:hypothetical protein